MAKLTAALLLAFVLETALVIFGGFSADTDRSSLFTMLMNPSALTNTIFYGLIVALFAIAATAMIVPGSFVQVNQWALYAVMAGSVLAFAMQIAHFWSFLAGQLSAILDPTVTCTVATHCNGWLIATMITAPLLIFYLIAIAEWARNN